MTKKKFNVIIGIMIVTDTTLILFVKIIIEVLIAIGVGYIVVLDKDERIRVNKMINGFLKKLIQSRNDKKDNWKWKRKNSFYYYKKIFIFKFRLLDYWFLELIFLKKP